MNRSGFMEEIQTMMYAVGDCRRPLVESACIVEEVVLRQIVWLIQKAQECAETGGGVWFGAEDLLMVLRGRLPVLRRLIHWMRAKDQSNSLPGENDDGDRGELEQTVVGLDDAGRRSAFCQKTLEKLDPTGELVAMTNAEFAAERTDRLRRINVLVSRMEAAEYIRFTDARQTSFLGRPGVVGGVRKFREWLFADDPTFKSYKPSPLTMEILAFLAKETLNILVECALCIRKEAEDAQFVGAEQPRFVEPERADENERVALALSRKIRSKPKNRQFPYGMDKLSAEAVKPWHLREAVRRLRYAHGNSPFKLFQDHCVDSDRVIF